MVSSLLTQSSLFLEAHLLMSCAAKGCIAVLVMAPQSSQSVEEFSYFLQCCFSALGFNLSASIWACCYCCEEGGMWCCQGFGPWYLFVLVSDVGWVYDGAKSKEIFGKSKTRSRISPSIHNAFPCMSQLLCAWCSALKRKSPFPFPALFYSECHSTPLCVWWAYQGGWTCWIFLGAI